MGMIIGCHSNSHIALSRLNYRSQLNEINNAKKFIEKIIKKNCDHFCYPFGRFNELISDLVKESGYLSATTMERGIVKSMTNRFMLPRMPINHRTLPHLFLAKILTNYEDRR